MKYDDLMSDYIGEFGVFQICFLAMMFMCALTGYEVFVTNFVAGFQDHWCKVEELMELPHTHQKYVAIPKIDAKYASCYMYDLNYSNYSNEDLIAWNRNLTFDETNKTIECTSWVYNQSQYVSTLTSKWDLVCGDQWKISLISAIYFAGYLLGTIGCGTLADWLGRKPVIMMCLAIRLGTNVFSAFAPNYMTFCIARFIMGFGGGGLFLSVFVLMMELVGTYYRPLLGTIMFLAGGLGFMMVVGISYRIRDHVMLQMALSLAMVPYLFYMIKVPESPRWLIVKGKYKKAMKLLKHIVAVNGTKLPENLDLSEVDVGKEEEKKGTLKDLFRSKRLRRRALIIDLHWFTDSLMYFGLFVNVGYLHGNMYINSLLMAAVDLPGSLFCAFALDWKFLGRRLTCSLSLIIAGIVQLIIIPIVVSGASTWSTALSLVVKCCANIGFLGIYVFSSELFPTEVRTAAMGQASMVARISGILAPFIGGPLRNVWIGLPSLVFGCFGILAGSMILLLPETLGQPLADTVEEAESFSGKKTSYASTNKAVAGKEVPISQDGSNEPLKWKDWQENCPESRV